MRNFGLEPQNRVERQNHNSMKYITICLALALSSCVRKGEAVIPSKSADNYELNKLFTADGITVYRFFDNGNYHYFTSQGETIVRHTSGKSSWDENIK